MPDDIYKNIKDKASRALGEALARLRLYKAINQVRLSHQRAGEKKLIYECFQLHNEKPPIQMHWNFFRRKNENFQMKNFDIFLISTQNIDCGCMFEPPQWGGSNEYPQSMF